MLPPSASPLISLYSPISLCVPFIHPYSSFHSPYRLPFPCQKSLRFVPARLSFSLPPHPSFFPLILYLPLCIITCLILFPFFDANLLLRVSASASVRTPLL